LDGRIDLNFACCFVWCETWSLTLREEHRLRVFENRVLRRIFGHKRNEVTGEWRRIHNEELSCDQIKKNEVGGTYNTYGGGERCIHNFGGDGRIILKWIFKKWDGGGGAWTGLI
jgi:hypothetical protein